MASSQAYTGLEVAIVGMACRFPGASNQMEFWNNLVKGVESVHFFSDEELLRLGVDKEMMNKEGFVRASAVLQNKDQFDAAFFDYRPAEAETLNPSTRIFQECVWEALEDAGYNPEDEKAGTISLYAGAGEDLNWKIYSMLQNKEQQIDDFALHLLNSEKYLTTLTSYKLKLTGPSCMVNTACSTSLVAVHLACRSLLLGECNIALSGGVYINSQKQTGYLYEEGMIHSKDGHCRAFDKDASGTIGGEGAGVVVLKRLTDALEDGDHIYAIIKGSAINNDGNRKVGFTAPGVHGLAGCISSALGMADAEPDSIDYIEAHGTGTRLGDPVEIEALNAVFEKNKQHRCAIGSVKTNIGHLDAAAGVAGLIKAALSLKYKLIPASLHFREPNPEINFDGGPFYVNSILKEWEVRENVPRRAGVSSFGIGGTNAHVVLEEAPDNPADEKQHAIQLLLLSARTEHSLIDYRNKLHTFLLADPSVSLANMSYTLQMGRKHFEYRQQIIYRDRDELIRLLEPSGTQSPVVKSTNRKGFTVFMFPGSGSQYVNMGCRLYEEMPVFRESMQEGFAILNELTGIDYRLIFYPAQKDDQRINEMLYAQPAIFLFGYSMARLLMSFGVEPQYMIGHSLGEFVCACVSGVLSYRDALTILVKRGQLMSQMLSGQMLSVSLSEEKALKYLNNRITLAAVNSSEQVVFSGDDFSMNELKARLKSEHIPFVKLHTSHAAHSYMIDAIIDDYRKTLETISFHPPQKNYISGVTGKLITEQEAMSVDYWVKHIRETARFSTGLQTLVGKGMNLYVELGGGNSLTGLVKHHRMGNDNISALNLVRHQTEKSDDVSFFIEGIGKLWGLGYPVKWHNYYQGFSRKRISLPTYAFEPVKYPVEVSAREKLSLINPAKTQKGQRLMEKWFYRVQWRQDFSLPGRPVLPSGSIVLVFADECGLAERLIDYLREAAIKYVVVNRGEEYKVIEDDLFFINPVVENNYAALFQHLAMAFLRPTHIFHLWNFNTADQALQEARISSWLQMGYESLQRIARQFALSFASAPVHIDVVANGWYSVLGNELLIPAKSTCLGAMKVIPLEFQHISCRAIDITHMSDESVSALWAALNEPHKGRAAMLTDSRTNEVYDSEIAIRGKNKYLKYLINEPLHLPVDTCSFKAGGTYLITGATGGMGAAFATFLAQKYKANLVLTGRSEEPVDLLNRLQAYGAGTFYVQASVADEAMMLRGIQQAEVLFGRIHGIIHAAGVADFGGAIIKRSVQDDVNVFASKIWGTEVLMSVFKNRKPDFFVNCSSQAASVGHFGQTAYVAANCYLDAIAEKGDPHYPIVSIEWNTIQEAGMAVQAIKHLPVQEQQDQLKYGITPAQACEVLSAAIYLGIPVLLISTIDLKEYLQEQFELFTNVNGNEVIPALVTRLSERPALSAKYLAPETDTEKRLVKVMEEFFGITSLGIADDFFELGGDSLKAMTLLKKVKKEFNTELSLKDFFENPTIKNIALYIDELTRLAKGSERSTKIII